MEQTEAELQAELVYLRQLKLRADTLRINYWNSEHQCPHCGGADTWNVITHMYYCDGCGTQYSVLAPHGIHMRLFTVHSSPCFERR